MRAPSGWLTLVKWGAVVTADYGVGVRLTRVANMASYAICSEFDFGDS
jgi:hypothetical protein